MDLEQDISGSHAAQSALISSIYVPYSLYSSYSLMVGLLKGSRVNSLLFFLQNLKLCSCVFISKVNFLYQASFWKFYLHPVSPPWNAALTSGFMCLKLDPLFCNKASFLSGLLISFLFFSFFLSCRRVNP